MTSPTWYCERCAAPAEVRFLWDARYAIGDCLMNGHRRVRITTDQAAAIEAAKEYDRRRAGSNSLGNGGR